MKMDKMIEEHINHLKDIRGYFLTDRKLINFIRFRPGNQDIDVIKEKVMAVANHDRADYFIKCGFQNHIKKLQIDSPLGQGELLIAVSVAQNGNDTIDYENIEFASRYCAVHHPTYFPLWNSHSLKIAEAFSQSCFSPDDYLEYGAVVKEMKSKHNLAPLNYFDISKFFWIYQDDLIRYYT